MGSGKGRVDERAWDVREKKRCLRKWFVGPTFIFVGLRFGGVALGGFLSD